MEFNAFIQKTQNLPVIDTKIFSAGSVNGGSMKVQISRWARSGKLIQLRRGLYLLPEPYRKVVPSEFYIASVLKNPSYISMEKAFEYYGLIPEAVHVFTSITTKRPEEFQTPVGRYAYQHVQASLFWGYVSLTINSQTAFMASPEKALLDFIYLKHPLVSLDYFEESMRLQNVGQINLKRLTEYTGRFNKKNVTRAVGILKQYIRDCRKGEKKL